jgi:hypothetical protein
MVRPVLNLLTNQTSIRYLQLQETCYAYTKLINQRKERDAEPEKTDPRQESNKITVIHMLQLTKYQMQRVMSDLEL